MWCGHALRTVNVMTETLSPQTGAAPGPAARPPRVHGLDALRGGALLLGILLHAVMPFMPGIPWLVNDPEPGAWSFTVIYTIHLFRMTLFMALAGYFGAMVVQRRGARSWLKDRAVRILLPAIAFWPLAVGSLVALAVFNVVWRDVGPIEPPDGTSDGLAALFAPGQLWFLWTLMHCVVITVVVRAIALRVSGPERLARLMGGLGRVLSGPFGPVLAALTYAAGLVIQGSLDGGIIAPVTVLPDPASLIPYLGAFVVGWAWRRDPGSLPRLARQGWPMMVVAIGLTLVGLATAGGTGLPLAAGVALNAVAGWAWVHGLVGVCVRHLTTDRPVVRYLADASYWMYLLHLPLLVLGEILVADQPWPVAVKVLVVLAATVAVLLVSYQLLVRGRWLGRWLNGRSAGRAAPRPSGTPEGSSPRSA